MITVEKFVLMPVEEQVTLLLGQGIELMDRIYIYYVVKLYRLNDFYVEIWYQQTTNRIDRVIVVELDDVIHLYESQINISDLFK
jgi:hypothetical protein